MEMERVGCSVRQHHELLHNEGHFFCYRDCEERRGIASGTAVTKVCFEIDGAQSQRHMFLGFGLHWTSSIYQERHGVVRSFTFGALFYLCIWVRHLYT
jgi:hypothetical protein